MPDMASMQARRLAACTIVMFLQCPSVTLFHQAMLQQNPEMVSAMMENPMVQQALENPGPPLLTAASKLSRYSLTHACSHCGGNDEQQPPNASSDGIQPGNCSNYARSCNVAPGECLLPHDLMQASCLGTDVSCRAWRSLAIRTSCRK